MNWPAVQIFLACETQWRVAATMAGLIWLGLDYAAAGALISARPRAWQRANPPHCVFEDLAVLEREALPVMNEPRP